MNTNFCGLFLWPNSVCRKRKMPLTPPKEQIVFWGGQWRDAAWRGVWVRGSQLLGFSDFEVVEKG